MTPERVLKQLTYFLEPFPYRFAQESFNRDSIPSHQHLPAAVKQSGKGRKARQALPEPATFDLQSDNLGAFFHDKIDFFVGIPPIVDFKWWCPAPS
jgi:hypothetical protein